MGVVRRVNHSLQPVDARAVKGPSVIKCAHLGKQT